MQKELNPVCPQCGMDRKFCQPCKEFYCYNPNCDSNNEFEHEGCAEAQKKYALEQELKKPILVRKKTRIPLFQDIVDKKKTFDIRLNDRDWKLKDILQFEEYNQEVKELTGRTVNKEVCYLLPMKVYCSEFVTVTFGEDELEFFSEADILLHGLIVLGLKDLWD